MDFELSDDQRALQEAAAALLDDLASSERVRAAMGDEGPGYDGVLWKAMVEQGWMGVELEEDQGGLGLGTVEAAVLFEQVGNHVAAAPFVESQLALGALARAGNEHWVERLVDGDAVGCVAWRLDAPVPYAPVADVAVAARDNEVVLVDLTAGPAVARQPAMDLTRPLGWLNVDGRPTTTIGGPDEARQLLDRGAAANAATLLGSANRVLDLAVEYAKERVQFGKPIGSFQAVKHRCADMLVDVEGMRSVAYWAAWAIGAGDPEASVAASTAKIWCSDAAKRVMASGLQVHGGIGFTWEHDLHLFLKRSQLDQVTFGDATWHRERLAHILRKSLESAPPVC